MVIAMRLNMMMTLIKKDVVEQRNDLKTTLIILCLPIAIFLLFYTFVVVTDIEVDFVEPLHIGVVNEDQSIYSKMLIDDFKGYDELNKFLNIWTGEKEEVDKKFQKKEIDAYVIIPEGFSDSLLYFEENPIFLYVGEENATKKFIITNTFKSYEQYIRSVEKGVVAFYDTVRSEVDRKRFVEYNNVLSIELIMKMLHREKIFAKYPIVNYPSTNSSSYYFFNVLTMFMFFYTFMLMSESIKDKNSEMSKRLQVMGVSNVEYSMGKVIFITAFCSFLSTIAITGFYSFFYEGKDVIRKILLSSFFYIIINFGVATIALWLVRKFQRESTYFAIISTLMFLVAILGGTLIPIPFMPYYMGEIAKYMPNYYIVRAMIFLEKGNIVTDYYIVCGLVFLCSGIIFGVLHRKKVGESI